MRSFHGLGLSLVGAWLGLAACQSQPAATTAATTAAPTAAAHSSMSPSSKLLPFQTEKFSLSAAPGCADGYPATILEGRFINSAGGSFPVPYGHFLRSAWTGSPIGWAVGEEMQAVPELLEIRWFSYTENKFYEGRFPLPQQRLYDLLKTGFWDAGYKRHGTYTGFTASVLPTGEVLVWLDGGNNVFIGRYQARGISYDFAEFIPQADRATVVREGLADVPPAVKREIATGTLNTKKWQAYLKTYPWQLTFSQPLTLTDFGLSLINGENLNYPPTPDLAAYTQAVLFAPTRKATPTDAMLYLAGAYGRKRLLKVETFDEHETMSAFQTLAAQHPGETITLFVEIDERLTKASLSLRAGRQVIPLTKSPLEFFDLP